MTDFSKLKGARISVLKQTRQDAEKKSKFLGNGNRPEFLSIKEGINIYRICPPFSEDQPSYYPIRSVYLDVDVPKIDDNGDEVKKDGKVVIERKKKRIFVATVHSDIVKIDPVETYIDFVYKRANDEFQDKELRDKFLAPITGWRDKKGDWNPGLRPSTNYVFYAFEDNKTLGRLEVYPQILKRMDELNVSEEKDQIIETDCFSDPIDGVSLIIDYDKSAGKGEKYKVSKKSYDFSKYLQKCGNDEQKALELFKSERESEKLTQVQLEEWYSKEPLVSMYKNVYSMRDFNLAINGLKIFDEANKYGIFENDEFIAKLEEIQATVPEPESQGSDNDVRAVFEDGGKKNTEIKTGDGIKSETIIHKEPDIRVNDHSTWNKIKCRKKLESYILENYGNDQILPDLDLATMRKWCELVDRGEELPFDNSLSIEDEAKAKLAQQANETKQPNDPKKIQENKNFDHEPPIITSGLSETQADKIKKLRERATKGK